jgi:uncharacterized damage-inducible protein DinB
LKIEDFQLTENGVKMEDLRYPIGPFVMQGLELTEEERLRAIHRLAGTPAGIRAAVRGLNPEQLSAPYRPEGWTVQQVVHHVADSHMNAFIRTKLALTEVNPTIKPYEQSAWAELPDGRGASLETSLSLIEGLHERWVFLLRSLVPADFSKTFLHPESGKQTIDRVLALYSWHGAHHTAHITALRRRMGW